MANLTQSLLYISNSASPVTRGGTRGRAGSEVTLRRSISTGLMVTEVRFLSNFRTIFSTTYGLPVRRVAPDETPNPILCPGVSSFS